MGENLDLLVELDERVGCVHNGRKISGTSRDVCVERREAGRDAFRITVIHRPPRFVTQMSRRGANLGRRVESCSSPPSLRNGTSVHRQHRKDQTSAATYAAERGGADLSCNGKVTVGGHVSSK
ncbi:hypothetical protein F2P81_016693 [Scophthalmus maximus]|uniref:Uncharacterized protein n=1 Tax=Scophthalmus maximus TaxID=52904 RepID=A0A6A4SIX3_SCOMX|nr:hypothetical protein F2P81_016693 [Scophthalmus maximus]